MNAELFFTIILSALFGHAIAWAFTPFQWIKKLGTITEENYLDLDAIKEEAPLTRIQNLHRLIAKAANCSPCASFWCCVGASCLNPSPWSVVALICSFTLASIVERMMN